MQRQDLGQIYSIMKQLGLRDTKVPNSIATLVSAETFKQHFKKVQENRNENDLAENIQERQNFRNNTNTEECRQAAKCLKKTPSETEITWKWSKFKEGFRGRWRPDDLPEGSTSLF